MYSKELNTEYSSSLDNHGITSHRTMTLYCEHCGADKTFVLKCSDRTCEFCRKRIYYKLTKGWLGLVENMRNPKLLTLTTVNTPELTKKHVQNIRCCFNKLMRRKFYKERILGGLYVIELKNIGKGWNIHIHALIDTIDNGYLDQKQISKDWLEITGDSQIVDIRKARNPKSSLRYILKYLVKTPEINGEVDIYNNALSKSRLIQTFGNFYRKKLEKTKLICENCGKYYWMPDFYLSKILFSFRKEKSHNKARYHGLPT